jgi:biotin transport system substrate-specific component
MPAPLTLVERINLTSTRTRTLVAVVGGALLTAAAAQLTFHLPWTPVPITGQTFAVLLTGTALGMRWGATCQALYVVLGAVGLPFYADAKGGWEAATGSTAGYLIGFVLAAAVLGRLAEQRQDRAFLTSLPAMLTGTAVIYLCGATWLAHSINVSAAEAVELGVAPFLIGDAVKLAAAGLLLPTAWRLLDR